ncbi:MAG: MFS transporter [Anaerolineaceae bacterium]|nr:MFS transporter [Anaerolineaceae bacterium]
MEATSSKSNWQKTYFTLWSGQALSIIGSHLVQFAVIWYLTTRTGSATILTTATLVGMLPQIILSPFVGALIDRWNRRKVMIAADTFIAFITAIVALLFLFDRIEIWHLYVAMFFRSLGGSFHYPAMTASTSLLVPKEQLTRVQGLNQVLDGILGIGAAPLGALLLEWLPIQGILLIDIITALIAVTALGFIQIPQPSKKLKTTEKNIVRQTIRDTWEGLQYVITWKGLFIFSLMMAMINLMMAPALSLIPLFVKNYFAGAAFEFSWTQSAFSVGMILGGVLLSIWGGFKRKMFTTLTSLNTLGILCLLVSILRPQDLIWFVVILAGMGFLLPFNNGPSSALRQEIIEPEMQGRYFALAVTLATAMSPIGLAIAGPLSDKFSIQTWYLIAGISILIFSLLGWSYSGIRNIDHGHPNKPIQSDDSTQTR